MSQRKRILWPVGAGLFGALVLSGLYFGIVSWAESPEHAIESFWQDRWIVLPIILGFGIQMALYVILKKRLYFPVVQIGPSGKLTGTSGGVSGAAMVACCAHHATDVLPIMGLSAAATFVAQYRVVFMLVGLGTTLLGILYMLATLIRERQHALRALELYSEVA